MSYRFIRSTFAAMLLAAMFGAVHDQISYSVSPEYFTLLKFQQFHLQSLELPVRIKASLVGVLATFWLGIPLGVVLALTTARWYGDKAQAAFWRLVPWLMVGTLAGALLGLGYGYWQTNDLTAFAHKRLPHGLVDVRAYITVGIMHKAAYLSAGVVACFGVVALYWRRPR